MKNDLQIFYHEETQNKRSDYFRQHAVVSTNFDSGKGWSVLLPAETIIKQKIEKVGTPLRDWDIQINYGIKTGFNEAFIINSEKRQQLLNRSPEADEIIRPLLRGRDIKRYSVAYRGQWLISFKLSIFCETIHVFISLR